MKVFNAAKDEVCFECNSEEEVLLVIIKLPCGTKTSFVLCKNCFYALRKDFYKLERGIEVD